MTTTDSAFRQPSDPFALRNVRLFVAFRLLFNARFYYPVFAILLLDFGLTLEQFALLNMAWAISIVLFEVPSGALADVVGRKNLVVVASALMVVEMTILVFTPRDAGAIVFWLFLVNRVLSGIAEAAASGADEALAYDTLADEGKQGQWGRVLEVLMFWQSVVMGLAMAIGGLTYDVQVLNGVLGLIGLEASIEEDLLLRIPVFLTLLNGIACLVVSLQLREAGEQAHQHDGIVKRCREGLGTAFRKTGQAGLWILRTPAAAAVILAGLLFDNVVRMFVTLNSEYYRLIGLPEWSYGFVSAGIFGLAIILPKITRRMAEHWQPGANFAILALVAFMGLVGVGRVWPYWGLLPVVFISLCMFGVGFFVSFYLNRLADSNQRATVLSFRGLAFNLAYGIIGLLYALLTASIRGDLESELTGDALQNEVFIQALQWFPGYFLVGLGLFLIFVRLRMGRRDVAHLRGEEG